VQGFAAGEAGRGSTPRDEDDLLFTAALDERALEIESGQLGHLHVEDEAR
jgi:hypothetical protein